MCLVFPLVFNVCMGLNTEPICGTIKYIIVCLHKRKKLVGLLNVHLWLAVMMFPYDFYVEYIIHFVLLLQFHGLKKISAFKDSESPAERKAAQNGFMCGL